MFTRATTLRFAAEDTAPQLIEAFAALREAVGAVAGTHDADTLTETFWAALHGLVTLGRPARLRPGLDSDRLQLLISQFTDRPGQERDTPARPRRRWRLRRPVR